MLELIFQLKCSAHVQEGLDTHKHMHMHLNEYGLLIKVCAKLYVRAENMNHNGDKDMCIGFHTSIISFRTECRTWSTLTFSNWYIFSESWDVSCRENSIGRTLVNFNQKSNDVISVEVTVDIEIKNTLLNTNIWVRKF